MLSAGQTDLSIAQVRLKPHTRELLPTFQRVCGGGEKAFATNTAAFLDYLEYEARALFTSLVDGHASTAELNDTYRGWLNKGELCPEGTEGRKAFDATSEVMHRRRGDGGLLQLVGETVSTPHGEVVVGVRGDGAQDLSFDPAIAIPGATSPVEDGLPRLVRLGNSIYVDDQTHPFEDVFENDHFRIVKTGEFSVDILVRDPDGTSFEHVGGVSLIDNFVARIEEISDPGSLVRTANFFLEDVLQRVSDARVMSKVILLKGGKVSDADAQKLKVALAKLDTFLSSTDDERRPFKHGINPILKGTWAEVFVGSQMDRLGQMKTVIGGILWILNERREITRDQIETTYRTLNLLSSPFEYLEKRYAMEREVQRFIDIELKETAAIQPTNADALRRILDLIVYEAGRISTLTAEGAETKPQLTIRWDDEGKLIIFDKNGTGALSAFEDESFAAHLDGLAHWMGQKGRIEFSRRHNGGIASIIIHVPLMNDSSNYSLGEFSEPAVEADEAFLSGRPPEPTPPEVGVGRGGSRKNRARRSQGSSRSRRGGEFVGVGGIKHGGGILRPGSIFRPLRPIARPPIRPKMK